jgi:hypothetical protein
VRIVALDPTTGRPRSRFRFRRTGGVSALAARGTRLYVAGKLRTSSRRPRASVLAVDTATGRVDRGFRPASARMTHLAALGGRLYGVGCFTRVGSTPRPGVVAYDPRSGALDRRFDPPASPRILPNCSSGHLQLTSAGLWVGSGGRVSVLDPRSGRPRARDSFPGQASGIRALVASGRDVFALVYPRYDCDRQLVGLRFPRGAR